MLEVRTDSFRISLVFLLNCCCTFASFSRLFFQRLTVFCHFAGVLLLSILPYKVAYTDRFRFQVCLVRCSIVLQRVYFSPHLWNSNGFWRAFSRPFSNTGNRTLCWPFASHFNQFFYFSQAFCAAKASVVLLVPLPHLFSKVNDFSVVWFASVVLPTHCHLVSVFNMVPTLAAVLTFLSLTSLFYWHVSHFLAVLLLTISRITCQFGE